MKPVAIIMGSKSDWKSMEAAALILKEFLVPIHIEILSAHRTPQKMADFASEAHKHYSLVIAGAGGAAHLPGMVASHTILPVIGVPVNIGVLAGLDALLSVVQMPKGIPVATVAVDNSENAGLLALRILAISNEKLKKKLENYRLLQIKKVKAMNQDIKKLLRKTPKS